LYIFCGGTSDSSLRALKGAVLFLPITNECSCRSEERVREIRKKSITSVNHEEDVLRDLKIVPPTARLHWATSRIRSDGQTPFRLVGCLRRAQTSSGPADDFRHRIRSCSAAKPTDSVRKESTDCIPSLRDQVGRGARHLRLEKRKVGWSSVPSEGFGRCQRS
jgi:hypothetical protein